MATSRHTEEGTFQKRFKHFTYFLTGDRKAKAGESDTPLTLGQALRKFRASAVIGMEHPANLKIC